MLQDGELNGLAGGLVHFEFLSQRDLCRTTLSNVCPLDLSPWHDLAQYHQMGRETSRD